MNFSKKFVWWCTLLELSIICILIFVIWKRHIPVLQNLLSLFKQDALITINPLSSKDRTILSPDGYRYYYEFPANETGTANVAWLNHVVQYHYNNDGLHDRFNYEITKEPGTFRIVTLGDSFVFGMWVDTKDNFSEQVEDMLNARLQCKTISKFEVINAGAPSYDMRYAAKRFMDKGEKYDPDVIVWFVRDENLYLNTDKYYSLEDDFKQKLLSPGAYLQYHMNLIDQFAASHLAYALYMDEYDKKTPDEQRVFIQPEIQAIHTLHHTDPASLMLLTPAATEGRYKEMLHQIATSEKNVFVEEVSDIRTFHPNDYHPNIEGHTQIAEVIFQSVVKNLLDSSCVLK